MLVQEYTEYPISDVRLRLIKSKLDDTEIVTRGGRILDRCRYSSNITDPPKTLQYELFRLGDELYDVTKIVRLQLLDGVVTFD